jgi:sugar phosphate isomerase/epimerase
MDIYVSTLNFGAKPLSELMGEIAQFPYSAIEISSGHPPEDKSWDSVFNYAKRYDASVILHNYAPPAPGNLLINLSNPVSEDRKSVIDFLKSRIQLTRELGSDYYSFHGGYRVPYRFGVREYPPSQILERGAALGIFIQALREVVAYAEAQGVHIGVENHGVDRALAGKVILYGRDDFEVMFDEVNSDFLHLHLDVGHLKVTCQALELDRNSFIEAFRDKIMGAHLHDNDGTADSHQPFGEGAWFLEQLRQLPRLQYASLETITRGDHQRIHKMIDLLDTYKTNENPR